MTSLNTAILVQGPQDPWEIFNVALRQLLFYGGGRTAPSDVEWRQKEEEDGAEYIFTGVHDELPALLAVCHRPGGELVSAEEASAKLKAGCTKPEGPDHPGVPAHLILGFATNVFYTDERSWNAGHLHSGLLWSVGGFLDSKKTAWKWQENVTYGIHEGYEDLERLAPAVERVRKGLSNPLGISQMISKEVMRRMGFIVDGD